MLFIWLSGVLLLQNDIITYLGMIYANHIHPELCFTDSLLLCPIRRCVSEERTAMFPVKNQEGYLGLQGQLISLDSAVVTK
jgi:hypothetical protein